MSLVKGKGQRAGGGQSGLHRVPGGRGGERNLVQAKLLGQRLCSLPFKTELGHPCPQSQANLGLWSWYPSPPF